MLLRERQLLDLGSVSLADVLHRMRFDCFHSELVDHQSLLSVASQSECVTILLHELLGGEDLSTSMVDDDFCVAFRLHETVYCYVHTVDEREQVTRDN